jgi:hypothetical protein
MAKKNNLDALQDLENQNANNDDVSTDNKQTSVKKETEKIKDNSPNTLDGYRILENYQLPQNGMFYPEYWKFAYRSPEANEIANFSTIQDTDQTGMIQAVEDLIRKCVVIWDTQKDRQISTGEILDGHRQFFLLLIREYYLPGTPIEYSAICSFCHEAMEIDLKAKNLKYEEFSKEILKIYDGRKFSFVTDSGTIEFLAPTLNNSTKILKYLMRTYKDNTSDKNIQEEKIVYDKKFLLIAPYLFETGDETIKQIIQKYKQISKDSSLMQEYIEIINKLKLDNFSEIDNVCEHCGSEEEAPVRFPGGWKNLFIRKTTISKYFN